LRRAAAAIAVFFAFPAAASAAGSVHSWAQPQIKLVTGQGIFAGTPATFDASAPLTEGTLARVIAKLTGAPAELPSDAAAPVSMEQLDRALVDAVGLGDAAYRFYLGARRAGLNPPKRFGTEAVARLIGLRLNHPAGHDELELQPQQTATRAEAAYSVAQILRFGHDDHDGWQRSTTAATTTGASSFAESWEVQNAKAAADAFELPMLSKWQRRIVGTALSYIGFPYIWGGTGDGTLGFDCSGFVWRVYKLTAYPNEGGLAGMLRGRTTMEMSGEVPRGERVGFKNLEPGDVLFFGRGRRSKPAQVDHAAIYLGNGWLINSSGFGVAIAPLDGWFRESFAWARRPLAEAGLA
jgi:cell wall-associated NlpC family hydrolase